MIETRRTLRLPKELSDWVDECAQRDHRSFNAQIIHVLEIIRAAESEARERRLTNKTIPPPATNQQIQ